MLPTINPPLHASRRRPPPPPRFIVIIVVVKGQNIEDSASPVMIFSFVFNEQLGAGCGGGEKMQLLGAGIAAEQ